MASRRNITERKIEKSMHEIVVRGLGELYEQLYDIFRFACYLSLTMIERDQGYARQIVY
jgi:hypothetical protein